MLQGSVLTRSPMHFPPLAALTFIDLVVIRVPPSHELEQVPLFHAPHSQSVGTARLKILFEIDDLIRVGLSYNFLL